MKIAQSLKTNDCRLIKRDHIRRATSNIASDQNTQTTTKRATPRIGTPILTAGKCYLPLSSSRVDSFKGESKAKLEQTQGDPPRDTFLK